MLGLIYIKKNVNGNSTIFILKTKNLLVLFETNSYGLTPQNLELFKEAGVDSFWLAIKVYDSKVHKNSCGVDHAEILFILLAFFLENKLTAYRPPNIMEMVRSYLAIKDVCLKNK